MPSLSELCSSSNQFGYFRHIGVLTDIDSLKNRFCRIESLNPSIEEIGEDGRKGFIFKVNDAITGQLIEIVFDARKHLDLTPELRFFNEDRSLQSKFDSWKFDVLAVIREQIQKMQSEWDESLKSRLINFLPVSAINGGDHRA